MRHLCVMKLRQVNLCSNIGDYFYKQVFFIARVSLILKYSNQALGEKLLILWSSLKAISMTWNVQNGSSHEHKGLPAQQDGMVI